MNMMSPERFKLIEEVFQAAAALEPAARPRLRDRPQRRRR